MPMRPRSLRSAATAAALIALLPAAAGALRVAGIATGVIAGDAQTEGSGAEVFGLDQSELPGTPFRIDFAYDPDLAPPDSNDAPDRSSHRSEDASTDWLHLAITVNGHTIVLRGDVRHAGVLDGNAGNGFGNDLLQLAIDYDLTDADSARREFLDFTATMPYDVLLNAELPSSFASDELDAIVNSANFKLFEVDLDPATGDPIYLRHVEFALTLHYIAASPVPEPGSAAFVGGGLVALAASRRARRSA